MYKREDGRIPSELRNIKISRRYLHGVEGSVFIECGNTKVLCTATLQERVPPFLNGTKTGWITAEYSMLPRASRERIPRESKLGRIGWRTHEIERFIGRSLRSVVDLSTLGERTILIDCDVIQADGGTRTAAVTGGFIALHDILKTLEKRKKGYPKSVIEFVAAVSVGKVSGRFLLDLTYNEDSKATVDMNIVMTEKGKFVEIQGTGEKGTFSEEDLFNMLDLGKEGINRLIKIQKESLCDDDL